MNILVVDDIAANRASLRSLLERCGHQVIEAGDGREALELMQRQAVDVIVSDILMPRMDGYRLCREVRRHEKYFAIPIIIATSTHTTEIDEQAALELGADKFLCKPIKSTELLDALAEVTSDRRLPPKPGGAREESKFMEDYSQRLVDKLARKNEELELQSLSLKKSEDRLQIVIENLTEGLVICDLDGHLLHWNPAALRMHGFASVEECRRKIRDFSTDFELATAAGRILPPEEWPLARIVRGETVRQEELQVRHLKAGWTNVFSYSGALAQDSTGNRLGFVSITDVTEARTSSRALAEERNLFRTVIDHLPVHVSVRDLAGKFVLSNTAHDQFAGVNNESELVGKTVKDVFSTGLAAVIEAYDQLVLRSGQMLCERESELDNGRESRWFAAHKVPLRDTAGTLVGLVDFRHDITDRREAEAAIIASEAFAKSILNSVTEHVVVINGEGRIIAVNDAWQRFARDNASEAGTRDWLGQNYLEICERSVGQPGAQDAMAALGGMRAVLAGKCPSFTIDYPCHSAGVQRWFTMRVTPLVAPGGGLVVTHSDITSQRLAAEEIKCQVDELQRWQEVTLGREERIQALKREVNELLAQAGHPPRYQAQGAVPAAVT